MTLERKEGREAIVLAGGLGTRLATVAPHRQKVAMEVAGEPMALRLARWIHSFGASKVVFAAGHLAADIEAIVSSNGDRAPELAVSIEPQPRGTAGAARLAASMTSADPVLVLNGDSFAQIDLDALYAFHAERCARASIALIPTPDPFRYGLVNVGFDGAVLAFQEKPQDAAPGFINAGIYLFEREALLGIAQDRAVSFEREVFPTMIGHGLYAMGFDARFIDIGTPESLQAAQTFFGVPTR